MVMMDGDDGWWLQSRRFTLSVFKVLLPKDMRCLLLSENRCNR